MVAEKDLVNNYNYLPLQKKGLQIANPFFVLYTFKNYSLAAAFFASFFNFIFSQIAPPIQ